MRGLFVIIITVLLLAASPAAADRLPQPVPFPDKVYCAECGMGVKGDGLKFASQIIMNNGKVKFFCDPGDMFVYYYVYKKKNELAAVYVRDYPSGSWLQARDAVYLIGSKVVTPMRYGILPFKDRPGAEKFKKEKGGGAIDTFDEVIASKVFKR